MKNNASIERPCSSLAAVHIKKDNDGGDDTIIHSDAQAPIVTTIDANMIAVG